MTASAADSPGLGLVKQNAVVVPPNTADLGRRRNASQEVGVRIDAAGQDITPPRVNDRGIVAGPACHALTQPLETALGVTREDTRTAEYFQAAPSSARHVRLDSA